MSVVKIVSVFDAHNFRADSNAASLWMQRAGKWLNVHFQESPLPNSVAQAAAVHVKDVDRILSFYPEDASVFPIAEPIVTGKRAIRENWEHTLGIPRFEPDMAD